MTSTITSLTSIAQAVLDTVETALASTVGGVPQSVYLDSGPRPAIDCESLVVSVPEIGEGTTSPLTPPEAVARRGDFGSLIQPTYRVWIFRCGPGYDMESNPSDAEKTRVATVVQQDGWATWNALRTHEDEIFDPCLGVTFEGGVALPEQGGYVGWVMSIHATLEGYETP